MKKNKIKNHVLIGDLVERIDFINPKKNKVLGVVIKTFKKDKEPFAVVSWVDGTETTIYSNYLKVISFHHD